MTRVLVTTHAITGHVRYAVPLVTELTAMGHEVLWYTGKLFEPMVLGAGAAFAPITERTGFDFSTTDALQQARGRGGGLRGVGRTVTEVFVRPIPAFIQEISELLDTFSPDILVADYSFMAGVLLAETRGLPRVAFSTGTLTMPSVDTAPHGTGLRPARGPLGRLRNRLLHRLVRHLVLREAHSLATALRAEYRLPELPGLFMGWPALIADRYIQSSIPGIEYPRRDLPESVTFVGAPRLDGLDDWTPPPWWKRILDARRTGVPVVFVTQGSAETDPRTLVLPTVEGLSGANVLVIGTTGGRPPGDVLSETLTPTNAILDSYIPFTEVMPLVDVMVTNGGLGGVQTALSHGVPIVAVGDTEDHMENNARVMWSGAGLRLRKERQSGKALADAVQTVLTDSSYRERARVLQAEYQRYPNAGRRAAEIVLETAARQAGSSSS